MIANPQSPKISIDEYLEYELLQECRYEYFNGEVLAMTGGTVPHNDIALNFYRLLYPHLRSRNCRINVADVKVQISWKNSSYYPDVVVSCTPDDLNARKFIQYPKIVVEVLSPGTEARDRGEKFLSYRTIPTLEEYILIESEKIGVELYRRGEGKMWLYYPYTVGDFVKIESIDFSCAIALLYEGITFGSE